MKKLLVEKAGVCHSPKNIREFETYFQYEPDLTTSIYLSFEGAEFPSLVVMIKNGKSIIHYFEKEGVFSIAENDAFNGDFSEIIVFEEEQIELNLYFAIDHKKAIDAAAQFWTSKGMRPTLLSWQDL